MGMMLNMNLQNVSTFDNNFEVLPPGEYPVRITNAEIKDAKSGSGQYLNLRYDIMDGQKKGRTLFDAISLWSSNQTAREVSARKLKSIGVAIRVANPDYIGDTDELIGGEMIVKVAITKNEQYGDQNQIKAYREMPAISVGGAPQGVTYSAQPQAAPQQMPMQQPQMQTAQPMPATPPVPPSENRQVPWQQ